MKEATEIKNELTVYHDGAYGYSSRENGRSTCYVDCPFCKATVTCYVWSLAGCGKKCPTCNALLTTSTATKRYKIKESKKFKGKLSCPSSCGPSDYCPGGKCDRRGCYEYDPSKFNVVKARLSVTVKTKNG